MDIGFARGGLWWSVGGETLAIDAPAGLAAAIGAELPRLRHVVLTGGRARCVGGLVELLEAAAAGRPDTRALDLFTPLGEERGAALADLWVQHWPDRYPLTIDSIRAGSRFRAGPFDVTTLPIRAGEPAWGFGTVHARVAFGLAVEHAGSKLVVLLGAAPEPALERYCAGADLAVIEVGVRPWPPSERAWRLRVDEAVSIGRAARRLWIVGDDGERLASTAET